MNVMKPKVEPALVGEGSFAVFDPDVVMLTNSKLTILQF